jgi:hypothetical protein
MSGLTRRDRERINHTESQLKALGLSQAECDQLRRDSMRLSRWGEMECNHDVQRDETTGKVTIRYARYDGSISKPQVIADRETPAIKRCEAIAKAHGLVFYHQGDPRGCAVYIGKAEDLRGHSIDAAYSNLIAVY